MSIRSKLISVNLITASVIFALIGLVMLREWNELQTLKKASEAGNTVSALSRATIELSLERSLAQVALNLDGPISGQLRGMLDKQRNLSNRLFETARGLLSSSTNIKGHATFDSELKDILDQIAELRQSVDRQVGIPLNERSPESVVELPKKIKSLVSALNDLSFDIRTLMRNAPPEILATDLITQQAWAVREYGGRERTIFAIATARKQPMSNDDLIYMNASHGRATQAWSLIEQNHDNPLLSEDVRTAIQTLGRTYFVDYNALRKSLLAAADSGAYPVDFGALFERSENALQTAISLLNSAVDSNAQKIDQALASAQTRLWLEAAIGVVVLGLLVVSMWFLASNIVGAIRTMTGAMAKLADGDMGIAIPGEQRRDEIGAMAKALGTFKENAVERARLEQTREKAQAAEADRQKHVDEAVKKFEGASTAALDAFMRASGELQEAANSLSSDAQGAIEQSATVTQAAEAASANVQRVASAAEQLTMSIQAITEQVNDASSTSEQAVSEAEQSGDQVRSLSQAAQKIGDVVSMIQDIAEQTNLLALNATIEASRAGEAGKGFAVVASEVKALASQTGQATEQIAEQVKAVQSATNGTVESIDAIAQSIRSVTDIATAVTSSVEEQGAATGDIARNVQHAAEGTTEVSQTIVGVSDAAKGTGKSAELVLSASNELAAQSERLQGNITEFLEAIRAA